MAEKANANPTKAFFVRMITRDIALEDCILDLIDNSVDGAWRKQGSHPMGLADDTDLSDFEVSIYASADRFRISDNCGGMTLSDAIDQAFSFGRSALQEHDDYSIGVYGIGMKRAVFKLGASIAIRSTYTEKRKRTSFAVPIDVPEWIKDDTPPWDFDIDASDDLEHDGVEIIVEKLNAGTKTAFGNPEFLLALRRTIARDYSHHLRRGLKISLNDEKIEGWQIELLQGKEFKPVRLAYDDEIDGEKVAIEIVGGMAAPPPEDSEPDEDDKGDKRFGWYVVCNGRIVLAADKTSVSGWDTDDWPQWHRQYSGFLGIIFFNAANAAALPLTTTKRSVDTSSPVFLNARPKMREISKAWIAYTNVRKQVLPEAKEVEQDAKTVSLYSVPARKTIALPQLSVPRQRAKGATITYTVPIKRLRDLASALGDINLKNREVGLKSFDYTYDDLVGED